MIASESTLGQRFKTRYALNTHLEKRMLKENVIVKHNPSSINYNLPWLRCGDNLTTPSWTQVATKIPV